jgi:hypothetical protein
MHAHTDRRTTFFLGHQTQNNKQDPVKFPTNISPEFKSFLKGLLNKRPGDRLGGRKGGVMPPTAVAVTATATRPSQRPFKPASRGSEWFRFVCFSRIFRRVNTLNRVRQIQTPPQADLAGAAGAPLCPRNLRGAVAAREGAGRRSGAGGLQPRVEGGAGEGRCACAGGRTSVQRQGRCTAVACSPSGAYPWLAGGTRRARVAQWRVRC